MRPGISKEMLAPAGVRPVDAEEEAKLGNLAEPGLWLPYRTLAWALRLMDRYKAGEMTANEALNAAICPETSRATRVGKRPPTLGVMPVAEKGRAA